MSMFIGALKRAIEVAEKSEYYPYKIGAVVFKGGRILSEGTNALRYCSRVPDKYKNFDHSLHAEQDALSKLYPDKAKGANMIVVRINESGNVSLAKPCENCQKMIKDCGIKWVYYSNRAGEIIRQKF